MRQLMGRLWTDDGGALIAVEWVFVATILIIGSITGLVALREAIVTELEEFAEAVMALSTSWCFHDGDDWFDDDDGGSHRHCHKHHKHCHEGDDGRHIGQITGDGGGDL
jgi:hypothetical protein